MGEAPDGPPEDLAVWCAAAHPRLVGALALLCGDRMLAEDLAQEAVVRLCEQWPRVRHLDHREAWLHRVGINLARSHFRRAEVRRRLGWAASRPEAVADVDVAQRVDVVRAPALLPPRQRAAVVLRHHLGYPTAEAAAVLGVPEGTVKSLLARGLARLRTELDLEVLQGDRP